MKKLFTILAVAFIVVCILAVNPNSFPALHGLGAIWGILERFATIMHEGISETKVWIDNAIAGDIQLGSIPLAMWILLLNLVTLILYGADKIKAEEGQYRVSNRILLGLAAAGGSIGAWTGMILFHHKTKKTAYRVGVPLMLVGHLLLLNILHP